MATITLEVPESLARTYDTASTEEREKLEQWVQFYLNDVQRKQKRSLLEIMDDLSDQAEANGLTPEILEEILADDN